MIIGRFLSGRVIHDFCERLGIQSIAELHPGLLQRDRFTNLIRTWKLQTWPEGQDINGVWCEFDRQSRGDIDKVS